MNERRGEKAQRLRLRYARGPEANTIGHLDVVRVWERAFESAGIQLSYTQGNRKQPRISVAAGLAMGATSSGELLDAILAEPVPVGDVAPRLAEHLPEGLEVCDVREVGLGLPALPSAVRYAEYEVDVATDEDIAPKVAELLAAETLAWEDTRGEKTRRYDLRSLIDRIDIEPGCDGGIRLAMRLRCDTGGVGRPDQVVKALGLPAASRIHRRRLVLDEVSPARDAWRRRGRFLS